MKLKLTLAILLLSISKFVANAQQTADSFLQDIIKIESYSSDESNAIDLIEKWASTEHFNTERIGKNIAVSLYPLSENKPNVILLSHLDVVPVMNEAEWKEEPFSGTIINDTIWGRGAIDCKGLATMQLYALKQLRDSFKNDVLPYNVTFLGVVEEETTSENGAKMIAQENIDLLNPIAMFGEGGSGLNEVMPSKPELNIFGISVAEKNSLWLELTVHNKSHAHGAMPPDLYANKKLIKVLINLLDEKRKLKFNPLVMNMFTHLGELEGGARGFVLKHINCVIFWPFVKKHFRSGEPFSVLVQNTFTITHIASSAEAANQISDRATAILDCRLLPGTDTDKFIKKIKRIAGHKVEIEILTETPNAVPSVLTPFYTNMEAALKEVYPNSETFSILFPASTDNNYFRVKDIPVYGIIPVKMNTELIETVHGNNERIAVSDLYKGIEVYFRMLVKSEKK